MWKTRFNRIIHQTPSGISVHQNPLFRWLTLGSDAIQTLINRHCPAHPTLEYVRPITLAASMLPGECCLLGLGGAGVAHALHPFLGSFKVVAVENSLDVIHIAKTYFMTDSINNLEIRYQDAYQFVQTSSTLFKHIIVDLFDAQAFPMQCFNSEFFEHCKSRLEPQGILAVNIANPSEQPALLKLIREHFKHCIVSFPVNNTANLIVFAYNNDLVLPLLMKLSSHSRVKKIVWHTHWGWLAELV